MKNQTSSESGLCSRRLAGWAFLVIAIVIGAAWPIAHAFLFDRVTARLCREMDEYSGVNGDTLPVFLMQNAFDGYVWNRLADDLSADGQWRVRHTGFDNHPEGREVHWNSGFAWYLRWLGEALHRVNAEPLRNCIFRMSIWANPILLCAFLLALPPLVALRFGPIVGGVLAISGIAVSTFYEGFLPAYPDHHGVVSAALMLMIMGIASAGCGWVRPENGPGSVWTPTASFARFCMLGSGFAGGVGMWISALSTSLLLSGLGIAMAAWLLLGAGRLRRNGLEFRHEFWLLWGACGAVSSSAFYLLEYAPNHIGIRLEVNHPLYAVAWMGGAIGIACLGRWRTVGQPGLRNFPLLKMLLAASACGLLPLTVLIGGKDFFAPLDAFVAGWHASIIEFKPLADRFAAGDLNAAAAFGWYPLLILASVVVILRQRTGTHAKFILAVLATLVALMHGLQLFQSRWVLLTAPVYMVMAVALAANVETAFSRRRRADWALAAGFAVLSACALVFPFKGHLLPVWEKFSNARTIQFNSHQARAMLHRDIARTLKEDYGSENVVLLSSPNSSVLIAALGGFDTIGTFYWENTSGLKAAAEILCAQTDAEALALIRKHRVTHIALLMEANFVRGFFDLLHPTPSPTVSIQDTLGYRLLEEDHVPAWAYPVFYTDNFLTRSLNEKVVLLRVSAAP